MENIWQYLWKCRWQKALIIDRINASFCKGVDILLLVYAFWFGLLYNNQITPLSQHLVNIGKVKVPFNRKNPLAKPGSRRDSHLPWLVGGEGRKTGQMLQLKGEEEDENVQLTFTVIHFIFGVYSRNAISVTVTKAADSNTLQRLCSVQSSAVQFVTIRDYSRHTAKYLFTDKSSCQIHPSIHLHPGQVTSLSQG